MTYPVRSESVGGLVLCDSPLAGVDPDEQVRLWKAEVIRLKIGGATVITGTLAQLKFWEREAERRHHDRV